MKLRFFHPSQESVHPYIRTKAQKPLTFEKKRRGFSNAGDHAFRDDLLIETCLKVLMTRRGGNGSIIFLTIHADKTNQRNDSRKTDDSLKFDE